MELKAIHHYVTKYWIEVNEVKALWKWDVTIQLSWLGIDQVTQNEAIEVLSNLEGWNTWIKYNQNINKH